MVRTLTTSRTSERMFHEVLVFEQNANAAQVSRVGPMCVGCSDVSKPGNPSQEDEGNCVSMIDGQNRLPELVR
jgi:hypothetical protein